MSDTRAPWSMFPIGATSMLTARIECTFVAAQSVFDTWSVRLREDTTVDTRKSHEQQKKQRSEEE